ncbi:hypothetical protein SprV_0301309900 [Sparganum proliferum]
MSYAPQHFSWVSENVAGLAFPHLRENLDYLVNRAHITHLITLCREKPEHIEDFPSLRHHYLPIGGFTEDDVGFVKDVVDLILNAESKNEKSGVHCQMGMMRTGTILAAYLANKNKTPLYLFLPSQHPGESDNPFNNLGLPKWPCYLEQCVSHHWSADDCTVEFWDVGNGTEEVCCSESLTFASFQSLTLDLKGLLEASMEHLLPDKPRLVSILWEPNILTAVVVHGVLLAGCAFALSLHVGYKEHLLRYRRHLAALIVLGSCPKELSNYLEQEANLLPFSRCFPPDLVQHSQLHLRPDFRLFVAGRGDANGELSWDGTEVNRRLAYCMTTSGSTGPPKTVLVAHSCVTANVVDLARRFSTPTASSDGLLLTSPLTFDASIVQIYLALATRRRLVLPSQRILLGVNCSALANVCAASKVGLWQCTPSLFHLFSQPDLLVRAFSDRQVDILLGGEPCHLTLNRTQWPRYLRIHCLYGLTEVSAWSSFLSLDDDILDGVATVAPLPGATPIGFPMLYSEVEVKNADESGVGEACLSRHNGGYAVAAVGEDLGTAVLRLSQEEEGTAWPTGDNVVFAPHTRSAFWFLGRQDRVIKVLGQKLHLERLEAALHRVMDECLAEDGLRVIHCVCAPQCRCVRASIQLTVIDRDKLKASLVRRGTSHVDLYASWRRAALSQLRASFLPIFLPRQFTFSFDAFPLSTNGKLAVGQHCFGYPPHCRGTIRDLCGLALNSSLTTDVEENSTFLELGGSSLSAMWLVESLITELALPNERSTLLTALFSQPLVGFLSHVENLAKEAQSSAGAPKVRRLDSELTTAPSPPLKGANPRSVSSPPLRLVVSVVWRHLLGKCVDASPLVVALPSVSSLPPEAAIFVGSHSGYFKALRHSNGDPLWSRLLSTGHQQRSRIEASACYFPSCEAGEAFVAVGTLDGPVYAMSASNGRLLWQTDTGGAVKSPPTPLSKLGLLLTGSHGRHLMALTVSDGRPAWTVCLDNSPLVAPVKTLLVERPSNNDCQGCKRTQTVVIAGSLGGGLHCVDAETGERVWTVGDLGPIFSAPLLLQPDGRRGGAGIVVATADGRVHCLTAVDGTIRWTKRPSSQSRHAGFFSDPLLLPGDAGLVLVASQSAHLYALRTEDGELAWSMDLSSYERSNASASAFLTTPLILPPPVPPAQPSSPSLQLLVCRTDGLLFACEIDPERGPRGEVSLLHRFPAETFSSPVLFRPHTEGAFWVYVGCRDDHIYGLSISESV